jgi:hypothetical protein
LVLTEEIFINFQPNFDEMPKIYSDFTYFFIIGIHSIAMAVCIVAFGPFIFFSIPFAFICFVPIRAIRLQQTEDPKHAKIVYGNIVLELITLIIMLFNIKNIVNPEDSWGDPYWWTPLGFFILIILLFILQTYMIVKMYKHQLKNLNSEANNSPENITENSDYYYSNKEFLSIIIFHILPLLMLLALLPWCGFGTGTCNLLPFLIPFSFLFFPIIIVILQQLVDYRIGYSFILNLIFGIWFVIWAILLGEFAYISVSAIMIFYLCIYIILVFKITRYNRK